MSKRALIVVDMQNDFISGSLGTQEARAIVAKVKERIQRARGTGEDVIFTRDTHSQNYLCTQEGKNLPVAHCICGTFGWELAEGLAAAGENARTLVLRYLSRGYVVFIRGTPLIMQIYLFFYLVGTAWGVENRFWAGVIILSIFEGAYIAEIIRGSYASLERTQLEAAQAVGFSPLQTLRYVVVPQMTARTLPALAGQFASIIKDSSLLSMISVVELTQTMREISAVNLKLLESYLFLGVLYLALTIPVAIASKLLERRFSYEA